MRTGSSDIGSTEACAPSARAIWPWAAVSVPPSAMKCVRYRQVARSRSESENQPGRAELLQALVDGERVVADAPAALLVDLTGEPVRAQVRVGADEQPVGLDVVARIGDHGELVADHVLEPGRELRPAGPAGENYDAQ